MSGEFLDSVKPNLDGQEENVKLATDPEKMDTETLTVEKIEKTSDYGLLSVRRTKSPFASGESSTSTTPDAETLNVPRRKLSNSSEASADISTSCKVSVGTDTCRDLPVAAAEDPYKSPKKPQLSLVINISTTNISAEGKVASEDVIVFGHGNIKRKGLLDEVLQSSEADEKILVDKAEKQTVSAGAPPGETFEPMELAAEADDQPTSEDTTCSSKMDEVSTDNETNLLKDGSESHSPIDKIVDGKPCETAVESKIEELENSVAESTKNYGIVTDKVKPTIMEETNNIPSSDSLKSSEFETCEDTGILVSIESPISSSNRCFETSGRSTKDSEKSDLGNEPESTDQYVYEKVFEPPTKMQKIDLLCGSPRMDIGAIEQSCGDRSVDSFKAISSSQDNEMKQSVTSSETIISGPRDASCQTIIEDVRLEISTSQLALGGSTSPCKADRPWTLKGVDQKREIYSFEGKEDILKKMEFHSHDENPTKSKRPRRGSSSEVTESHTTVSSSELLSLSDSPSVTESSSQSEAFASRSISSASSPVPKSQSPQSKSRTQSISGSSSEKTESTGVSSKDKSGDMNVKGKEDQQTKEEKQAAQKLFGKAEYERMRKSGPQIKVDFDVEQCSRPSDTLVSDHSSLSIDQEDTCSDILFEKKSPSLDEHATAQAESSGGGTVESMDVDQ